MAFSLCEIPLLAVKDITGTLTF